MVNNKKLEKFLQKAKEWTISQPNINSSSYFADFYNNLFACYFLYDCIVKGIEIHKKSIESRIPEISKRIQPDEANRIKSDFEKVITNTEIIAIPAYEFLINYLYALFNSVYRENLQYLKSIEKIEYKGFDIINKILKARDTESSSNFIIEDLINLKILGTKERGGNLKTNPNFWLELIEETKIKLDREEEIFWLAFHDRRNAASHIEAKERWEKVKNNVNLNLLDLRIWIYGLLMLAYKIDEKLSSKFNFDSQEVFINIMGEPIYEMEQFFI